ncbi:MAG: hypothetical protein KBI41_04150 [Kiritimatiellae bacterium]|nr:hypothetical protein [Kiritimatiellia bacterium]
MRRKMIGMVLVLAAGTSLAGWFSSERPVTVRSLLAEMTDREEMARFPEPTYTSRQFSSYDRGLVAPDQPGWYANNDFSHFLRVETNGVRREHVMVDTAGPGALVRFWVTVAGTDGSGILRVYLDGRSTPEIEGPVLEVLSGSVLCGYPLAASVSEHTDYLKRGHNLYLPIPYAVRCVVTYESATLGLTHANDYGIADIALNGKRLITAYDAFAEKVETHVVQAGIVELVQGENVLTVTLTGANPKTKKDNFMQGVDRLELVSAERGTQNVERQRDYPPVEAVLTNLNITVNSVTNLAETLQTGYARQYPGGPPLKFSVYLRDSFKPSEWKELGPNYHVCAVSNHTNPELKFRLSVPAITVAEVLSVVSDNSKWNWWTYRDEVIIEPSVPMFQPSLLNYDAPGAGDALKVVLAHLFSDTHALSDARMYLGDLGQGKSPVLRRIVLPRSSLPDGFIPPDVGVPFEICEKHHDLVTGELLVRVHRVLSRGPDGFRVDLFVTGADSIGDGWFTYTLTKLDELWKPKYCGFYDP